MNTLLITPTDEQEKIVTAFLNALNISFIKEEESLPDYVLKGIVQGEEDYKAGRTVSLEDFKKKLLINKNV